MPSLSDLKLFLRVSNTLSITDAARQLNITPAAVSAAIKRLEATLRTTLFERTTRTIRLTPQGESFCKTCQYLLEVWAHGKLALQNKQDDIEGDIHIAAPTDITYQILAKWIPTFLDTYPHLNAIFHTSDQLHDVVKEGIDIAIRYGTLNDSSLVARKLGEYQRIAVASPDYLAQYGEPLSPQELVQHHCLTLRLHGQQRTSWVFAREHSILSIDISGRLCGDGALVREWALKGLGIAYKTSIDVAEDIRHNRLIPLFRDFSGECVPIHAILPSGRYIPQRVRVFIDFLANQFNQHQKIENHLNSAVKQDLGEFKAFNP